MNGRINLTGLLVGLVALGLIVGTIALLASYGWAFVAP